MLFHVDVNEDESLLVWYVVHSSTRNALDRWGWINERNSDGTTLEADTVVVVTSFIRLRVVLTVKAVADITDNDLSCIMSVNLHRGQGPSWQTMASCLTFDGIR